MDWDKLNDKDVFQCIAEIIIATEKLLSEECP